MGFGLLITLGLAKCTSNSNAEFKKKPSDTTITFIQLVTPLDWAKWGIAGNQPVTTIGWRLTKDTFDYEETDAETKKKIWKRDTLYAIEIRIPKKDTANGQKDSMLYPMVSPKHILIDFNKNPNKL